MDEQICLFSVSSTNTCFQMAIIMSIKLKVGRETGLAWTLLFAFCKLLPPSLSPQGQLACLPLGPQSPYEREVPKRFSQRAHNAEPYRSSTGLSSQLSGYSCYG